MFNTTQTHDTVTFNSLNLSMYTCLGWSSPSSYSQISVSSSFSESVSLSCDKEKQQKDEYLKKKKKPCTTYTFKLFRNGYDPFS